MHNSGKEFSYDRIMREEVVTFAKSTDSRLKISCLSTFAPWRTPQSKAVASRLVNTTDVVFLAQEMWNATFSPTAILRRKWKLSFQKFTTALKATGKTSPPSKRTPLLQKFPKWRKKWLIRQALWQIYLPSPKHISRPKFHVPTPGRPSFSSAQPCGAWPEPKNIQIHFDRRRCGQPF